MAGATKDEAIVAAREVAIRHGVELGKIGIADFVDEKHDLASIQPSRIGHWFLVFSPKDGPGLDTEIIFWVDSRSGEVTCPKDLVRRPLLARLANWWRDQTSHSK